MPKCYTLEHMYNSLKFLRVFLSLVPVANRPVFTNGVFSLQFRPRQRRKPQLSLQLKVKLKSVLFETFCQRGKHFFLQLLVYRPQTTKLGR